VVESSPVSGFSAEIGKPLSLQMNEGKGFAY